MNNNLPQELEFHSLSQQSGNLVVRDLQTELLQCLLDLHRIQNTWKMITNLQSTIMLAGDKQQPVLLDLVQYKYQPCTAWLVLV